MSEEKRLTPAQKSSLEELFLRGVAKIGVPDELTAETLLPVLEAGLSASWEFAREMMEGRTERAVLAREALTAEVYGRSLHLKAREQFLQRAEQRAQHQGFIRAREGLGL